MWRCNADLPAPKPPDFDGWLEEIGELADSEGFEALVGVLIRFAPAECVRHLSASPAIVASLIARARYADGCRFARGVAIGRRLGL